MYDESCLVQANTTGHDSPRQRLGTARIDDRPDAARDDAGRRRVDGRRRARARARSRPALDRPSRAGDGRARGDDAEVGAGRRAGKFVERSTASTDGDERRRGADDARWDGVRTDGGDAGPRAGKGRRARGVIERDGARERLRARRRGDVGAEDDEGEDGTGEANAGGCWTMVRR